MTNFHAIIASVLLSFPSTASAAAQCQGTVTEIIVAPEGDFLVDFGFGRTKICQLDGTTAVNRGANSGGTASITPTRCNALYSAFLTANAGHKAVTAMVDASDCTVLIDGAYPNPYPYSFYFPG